jgi:hypothetical protein
MADGVDEGVIGAPIAGRSNGTDLSTAAGEGRVRGSRAAAVVGVEVVGGERAGLSDADVS